MSVDREALNHVKATFKDNHDIGQAWTEAYEAAKSTSTHVSVSREVLEGIRGTLESYSPSTIHYVDPETGRATISAAVIKALADSHATLTQLLTTTQGE